MFGISGPNPNPISYLFYGVGGIFALIGLYLVVLTIVAIFAKATAPSTLPAGGQYGSHFRADWDTDDTGVSRGGWEGPPATKSQIRIWPWFLWATIFLFFAWVFYTLALAS